MIVAILIMNGLGFMNAVYATSIKSSQLYTSGNGSVLSKYKTEVVTVSYVQYSNKGLNNHTYCLDKKNTGEGAETESYHITIIKKLPITGM